MRYECISKQELNDNNDVDNNKIYKKNIINNDDELY